MQIPLPAEGPGAQDEIRSDEESRGMRLSARLIQGALLAAILLLALGVRFWNLNELGYANHYYAAAIKSMLQSWHNFFFVAAEPGGSVSIDKPPLGLWIQAASAWVFGINSFGLLLPQILAGLLSCWLVYRLAERAFGGWAGLAGALVLALTPVVVATDRNNTMDSLLILTLLLSAWAFIRAAETAKLRWLLLGALLVGVGFNIKTLAAFFPLPAFYALYFLGAKEPLGRKLGKLALASLLLLGIALSWITIVDLVPAAQRPYVGSSGDNSEWSLAIGYNGVNRLLGMRRQGLAGPTQQQRPNGGGLQPPANGRRDGIRGSQPGMPPGQGGGGFPGTGRPGLLRLFTAPLSKEMSWLLPFGLLGAGLLAFTTRLAWPFDPRHQALVLWGGWLLTGLVFFSVAGFFHEYYLSILGAPLAMLAAAGVGQLTRLHRDRPWLASAILLAGAGLTLAFQTLTAQVYTGGFAWTTLALLLFGLGGAALVVGELGVLRALRGLAVTGAVLALAALLVIPGAWSFLTAQNASSNQSLPAAYTGTSAANATWGARLDGARSTPGSGGSLTGLNTNAQLLAFLQANTAGQRYLMAVPSSMQGADYVLATGRPVLYLGGFNGSDEVLTLEQLQALIANSELRYLYIGGDDRAAGPGGGGPGGSGGSSAITSWVRSSCATVSGFETPTRNAGAPDGATGGTGGFSGGGSFNLTLYDCGG
jgi:4-amino-4-deoxy-L-arabinose transferase-like glycosyltransferase